MTVIKDGENIVEYGWNTQVVINENMGNGIIVKIFPSESCESTIQFRALAIGNN